jgi:aspartyl-tRNA(Asn)/glutamyl-tRNA(Gln) amidotransferase subunit B
VTEAMLAAARAEIPELPADRAARFERDFGLSADRARNFARRAELGDYFEAAVATLPNEGQDGGNGSPVVVANWLEQLVERISSDVDPSESRVSPASLASLATMVAAKEVSRDAGREVLTRLVDEGGDPRTIVEREGLGAISDDDGGLVEIVDRAIASDPAAAAKVRDGNM